MPGALQLLSASASPSNGGLLLHWVGMGAGRGRGVGAGEGPMFRLVSDSTLVSEGVRRGKFTDSTHKHTELQEKK